MESAQIRQSMIRHSMIRHSMIFEAALALTILSFSSLVYAQESANPKAVATPKAELKSPKAAPLKTKTVESKVDTASPQKMSVNQTEPSQSMSSSKAKSNAENQAIEERIQNLLKQSKRKFEYGEAARYTHLKWSERMNKFSVGIMPIKNYSGIPIEERDESADYYDHGKLPAAINHLFYDLLTTSRQFELNQRQPDYWLQLSIEEYRLPFPYASNDEWWQTPSDTLDRAFTSAKPAQVKLSLKMIAGGRPLKQWKDAASMTISNCDLNTTPQALSSMNNQNQTIKDYLTTTPGQAFLSASNFLIMQATKRLTEEGDYAYVEKIIGDEIHLRRDNSHFKVGETLLVHFTDQSPDYSPFNKKQIKVIKATSGFAIAYPLNIRADHLNKGDFVKTNSHHSFESPGFRFNSTGQCAEVIVAQAE